MITKEQAISILDAVRKVILAQEKTFASINRYHNKVVRETEMLLKVLRSEERNFVTFINELNHQKLDQMGARTQELVKKAGKLVAERLAAEEEYNHDSDEANMLIDEMNVVKHKVMHDVKQESKTGW